MARKQKRVQRDLRERAREALAMANAVNKDEFTLEAFMATFHPEFQKDRERMSQLRAAQRIGR